MERSRAMRRDALDNRARILTTAEEYFGAAGLDASLHELARRAGVGIGTIYRHFPQHSDILRALYDRLVERLAVIGTTLQEAPTAWDGVVGLIDGTIALYIEQPVSPALLEHMNLHDAGYRPEDHYSETFAELARRGRAEGSLREDLTGSDLALAPYMLTGALRFPEPIRSLVLARQRALLLDSLRPAALSAPLPALDILHLPGIQGPSAD